MHSVKEKKKVSKKMAKDDELKMRFLLKDTSQYFRWIQEMTTTLSKCKLLPTMLGMTDALFEAYFDEANPAGKKISLEKINVCTSVVGESILDTQSKKAWHRQHTKVRATLLEQAQMLRDCVFAVRDIGKPAQIELQRKIELAKFQVAVSTEPTENTVFVICLRSITITGKSWRAWGIKT